MIATLVHGLCVRFKDSCAEAKLLVQRALDLTNLQPLLLGCKDLTNSYF